ncbi:MAG: aldehyde dehydrogenase family protein, partial [Solirubrobacteraceae bacterium]
MDATDDRPLLLGGSWVERDAVLEVRDPEDGSLVGRTAVASVQDAQLAVTMAETASPLPRAERSSVLERAAERVDERAAELAETIAREGIKTIREARREVGRCATTLRLAASEAR